MGLTSLAIGIAVIVLLLLFLRFILKTAFTLLKVALIIGIGFAIWLGVGQLTNL